MTESELSEIEARANAATPGKITYKKQSHEIEHESGEWGWELSGSCRTADIERILAGWNDIPALIAEVRRLRAELDAMKLHDLKEWHRGCISRDEVRRLSERKID